MLFGATGRALVPSCFHHPDLPLTERF